MIRQCRAGFQKVLTVVQNQQQIGDQSGIAYALLNLGCIVHSLGDLVSARSYLEQSLVIRQEIGEWGSMAYSLCGLGLVAYTQEDYAFARSCYEQSLTLFQQIGDQNGIAHALKYLGSVVHSQGDTVSARSHLEQSLSLFRGIGRRRETVFCLEAFAELESRESKADRATVLWGAAEALWGNRNLHLLPGEQEGYNHAMAASRQILGEEAFLAAWEQGRSLTLEQAIEYALETVSVHDVAHQLT